MRTGSARPVTSAIKNRAVRLNRVQIVLRRNIELTLRLLLIGIGLLFTADIGPGSTATGLKTGPFTVLDPPLFDLRLSRGRLELSTTTASRQHESDLRSIVARLFADRQAQVLLTPGIRVPDSWAVTTTSLLRALAVTESADATMSDHNIIVRGVTANPEEFAARLGAVRDMLPTGTVIDQDMTALATSTSLDTLCSQAFAEIVAEPVAFEQSSAEIKTSSYSMLDKLIDFAYDCQNQRIRITGHTDASGDEAWNRRLSRLRAQSVADYLARGGIEVERLQVDGKGSSVPVADNETRLGRSLNRRIEFTLVEPLL